MTIETSQAWGAIHIYGLPDPVSPQSGNGVVFSNGLFTLPSEISSATNVKRAWMTEIGGETYTANLREPCQAGGSIRAIIEDRDGLLSASLIPAPNGSGYYLEDAIVSASATTLHLSGNTAPTVNQILWIENEAVKVTVVASGHTQRTWTVTVTRGVCSSFAVAHHLTPSVYWVPGSAGTGERIQVTTKPAPTRHTFFARAYRLRDAGSSTVVSHARDLYLARIVSSINPRICEFHFEPIGKLVEEFQARKDVQPVQLSHCIELLHHETHQEAGNVFQPENAVLWLTAREASLLLDWPFRQCGATGIESSYVTAAQDVFVQSDRLIHGTTSSGDATWSITALEHIPVGVVVTSPQEEFIRIGLSREKSNYSLAGRETEGFIVQSSDALYETAGVYVRYEGGWSEGPAVPLPEGDPPAVEFWFLPALGVAPFFAQFLVSNKGEGGGGSRDTFPPGFGLGLPDTMVNWDVTAVNPSLDTLALAELNQLYTQVWLWPLKPKVKVSDLLNSICRLLRLLPTPLKEGGITLRVWARPFTSVANEIVLEQEHLTILDDVRPLRVLEFVSGIDLLTFGPKSKPRSASVQSTKVAERGDADRIWILTQDPNALSDAAFGSGDIFACCRCFFVTLQGEPLVLKGMTDLDVSSYETVDYVTLTDEAVPTENGRGVSGKRYILISIGLSWNDAGQPVLMLPDELNNPNIQSTGKIAPTLQVTEIRSIVGEGPTVVTIYVTSIGDDTFDGTTAHSGIWADIAGTGTVRIIRPIHNVIGDPAKDRPGWLECYADLTAISYVGPESSFTLEIDDNFLHDGLTIADYLVGGESFITLMDVNTHNRLTVRVEPINEQWYDNGDGLDFLKFDGVLPVDGHRSLIGT